MNIHWDVSIAVPSSTSSQASLELGVLFSVPEWGSTLQGPALSARWHINTIKCFNQMTMKLNSSKEKKLISSRKYIFWVQHAFIFLTWLFHYFLSAFQSLSLPLSFSLNSQCKIKILCRSLIFTSADNGHQQLGEIRPCHLEILRKTRSQRTLGEGRGARTPAVSPRGVFEARGWQDPYGVHFPNAEH